MRLKSILRIFNFYRDSYYDSDKAAILDPLVAQWWRPRLTNSKARDKYKRRRARTWRGRLPIPFKYHTKCMEITCNLGYTVYHCADEDVTIYRVLYLSRDHRLSTYNLTYNTARA